MLVVKIALPASVQVCVGGGGGAQAGSHTVMAAIPPPTSSCASSPITLYLLSMNMNVEHGSLHLVNMVGNVRQFRCH